MVLCLLVCFFFFFTLDSSYSREPNYSSINIQTHYTFPTHVCTCRAQIHASGAFDVVPTSTRTFDSFRSFFFCALKMFVFPSVVHSNTSSVILCVERGCGGLLVRLVQWRITVGKNKRQRRRRDRK